MAIEVIPHRSEVLVHGLSGISQKASMAPRLWGLRLAHKDCSQPRLNESEKTSSRLLGQLADPRTARAFTSTSEVPLTPLQSKPNSCRSASENSICYSIRRTPSSFGGSSAQLRQPQGGKGWGFTETLNLGKYTGFHLAAETTQGSVFPNYPFENDLLQALRTASWARASTGPINNPRSE